jgi:hypothetical protein
MTLPWPKFWSHLPESDRPLLSDALSELLRYGAILGDEGSGRELFRLVRDRCRTEVEEYLAPLGLRLIVHEDPLPLLQAEPVPDECALLARFSQQETILALVLWRIHDERLVISRTHPIIFSTNDVWLKWQVFFPKIEPPKVSAMKDVLIRMRQKKFVRFTEANDPSRPSEALIEVLPSLVRAIDFNGIEEWQEHAAVHGATVTGETVKSE